MDVFDYGAIIIFISAEDDNMGKFLSANQMFYDAMGYTDK